MSAEVWKTIPGFECYEASSMGRIRSKRSNRILKVHNNKGYLKASLSVGDGEFNKNVHGLVLAAFVGPREDGMQTRHLNGVRTDNRLENLVWGSARENHLDKVKHGTAFFGDKHPRSKLSSGCVERIRDMRRCGVPRDQIQKLFGVEKGTITRITKGRIWAAVGAITTREV